MSWCDIFKYEFHANSFASSSCDTARPPRHSRPPPFLFVLGSFAGMNGNCVGIVGSRHTTPYGRGVSERFGRELAAKGVTVVSGGAVGINAAAHRGAVAPGGRTAAVLGCGLDVDYPKDNRELFEKIVENGALVLEYALGVQPETWRFPLRKRSVL